MLVIAILIVSRGCGFVHVQSFFTFAHRRTLHSLTSSGKICCTFNLTSCATSVMLLLQSLWERVFSIQQSFIEHFVWCHCCQNDVTRCHLLTQWEYIRRGNERGNWVETQTCLVCWNLIDQSLLQHFTRKSFSAVLLEKKPHSALQPRI